MPTFHDGLQLAVVLVHPVVVLLPHLVVLCFHSVHPGPHLEAVSLNYYKLTGAHQEHRYKDCKHHDCCWLADVQIELLQFCVLIYTT